MIKIKVDKFEGPLDTLLFLIKKEKIDITEISLAKVTDQYLSLLESLQKIDLDELADFLVVASKLIYLKTKVLLPHLQEDEEEDDDLVERLKIYKEYLEASKKIKKILEKNRHLFSSLKNKNQEKIFSPPHINLYFLQGVLSSFLDKKKQDKAYLKEEKIIRRLSLKKRIEEIEKFLLKEKKFVLSSSSPKEEKIVSFLAILEISRQKEVSLFQEEFFSKIVVTVK